MIKHLNDNFLLLSQYIQWRTQESSMKGGGGVIHGSDQILPFWPEGPGALRPRTPLFIFIMTLQWEIWWIYTKIRTCTAHGNTAGDKWEVFIVIVCEIVFKSYGGRIDELQLVSPAAVETCNVVDYHTSIPSVDHAHTWVTH